MPKNKTQPSDADVDAFLDSVVPVHRAADARKLDALFQIKTGFVPHMWGTSIVGYGRYHYVYESGRSGDFLATGFSPRKSAFSIYIMPGYADFSSSLERLGPHKTGKSCLYIKRLDDIDLDVLGEIISSGLDDLRAKWPVFPE